MNREYELTFIVRVDPSEEVMNETVTQVQSWIQDEGNGRVENVDRWGRRKLAYQIDGQREGYYTVMNFEGEPDMLPELERKLKLSDRILRYLLIRANE